MVSIRQFLDVNSWNRTDILGPLSLKVAVTDAKDWIGLAHLQSGQVVNQPVIDGFLSFGEQRPLREAEVAADTTEENQADDACNHPCDPLHPALDDCQKNQGEAETQPDRTLVGCIKDPCSYKRHHIGPVKLPSLYA